MRALVLAVLLTGLGAGQAVGSSAAAIPTPVAVATVVGWSAGASTYPGISAAEPDGRGASPTGHLSRPGASGLRSSEVLGVRAPVTTDQERATHWGWPLAGVPEIARGFDPPEQRWGAGHRGIDLVGVLGEPVLSTEAGVVTYSGVVAGVGVVSVTHVDGLRSTYQPVSDRIGRGARVARGDRLGVLDLGGHCLARDCLHLGAVRGRDTYVDPTPMLVGVELTLRPLL